MKRLTRVVVLLAIIAGPALAQKPAKTAPSDPKPEVRTFVKAMINSINEGDLSSVAEMYLHDNEVSSISDGEVIRGYDAVRKELDSSLGLEGKYKYTVSAIDVVMLGGTHALAFAPCNVNLKVAAGDQKSEANILGAFTFVLRRTSEGWRVLHEHLSTQGQDPED